MSRMEERDMMVYFSLKGFVTQFLCSLILYLFQLIPSLFERSAHLTIIVQIRVSASTIALHQNETVFPSLEVFNSSRWLDLSSD